MSRHFHAAALLLLGGTVFAEISAPDHWAWQPLFRPDLPKTSEQPHPIDAFIEARLKPAGLTLAPEADRRSLIRRLTFNLTGLPPTPKEIAAFEEDASPNAYEKLLDRLLDSPAYGEHFAQHWLDLARFAETDGFEHDKLRPNAWRYRDWIIRVLNDDLPYDQFVKLQLAGDLLLPEDPQAAIATGFLLAGQDMPDINLQTERRHMVLNEMTSTVGNVFLGLTLGCAQCHDHKSDPLLQREFYMMRAFFESDLALKESTVGKLKVRAMKAGKPLPTHLMIRGDFRRPGKPVQAGVPGIANSSGVQLESGTRKDLADWLIRPDNALALRVMANRLWQWHFGEALAESEDFGRLGRSPSHPQLLDWLARELPRRKWSLKAMHRIILTSMTWRQASRSDVADKHWQKRLRKDSENRLWSRQDRRRLTGEMVRDTLLTVSGSLSGRQGGPGIRPPLPKEITGTLLHNQWKVSESKEDHRRRSIYLFLRRNLRYPMFDLFDSPPLAASCVRRKTSVTAPQALSLLNSEFVNDSANRMAQFAMKQADNANAQVRLCYERILGRLPTPEDSQYAASTLNSTSNAEQGLADICLALFNLNEFLYMD